MSPSNGLITHRDLEQAMDGAQIIIVPASPGDIDPETKEMVDFGTHHEAYKIRVLDESLLDSGDGLRMVDVSTSPRNNTSTLWR
jgi:hypothetical protein